MPLQYQHPLAVAGVVLSCAGGNDARGDARGDRDDARDARDDDVRGDDGARIASVGFDWIVSDGVMEKVEVGNGLARIRDNASANASIVSGFDAFSFSSTLTMMSLV